MKSQLTSQAACTLRNTTECSSVQESCHRPPPCLLSRILRKLSIMSLTRATNMLLRPRQVVVPSFQHRLASSHAHDEHHDDGHHHEEDHTVYPKEGALSTLLFHYSRHWMHFAYAITSRLLCGRMEEFCALRPRRCWFLQLRACTGRGCLPHALDRALQATKGALGEY